MSNNLSVSVVIPTYKRPDQLSRAVDSVLNQSYPYVDVIVVDDNNPNTEGRSKTEAIMVKYSGNSRVKYIKHEVNRNGSAARNTGAKHSTANFIAFLDDDDEYLPKKIESQLILLESLGEDWGCCYSRHYDCFNGKMNISTEKRQGDVYLLALMRKLAIAAGSNLLIRKDLFDKVGGFDESFVRFQDLELLAKLSYHTKIAYDPTPGLIVYIHTDNRNIDYDKLTQLYLSSFKKHIDNLSVENRKIFYSELNKQRFVYFFRTEKNILKCLRMIKDNEVSFLSAISILFFKSIECIKRRLPV